MKDFILSAFSDEAANNLDDQIAALTRNNITMMEIRGADGHGVSDLDTPALLAIKKRLDQSGITVSAIGSPIGKYPITDPFEPHLERFRKAINAAKILGTKRIRMFSFFTPPNENPEIYTADVLARMQVFTDIAAENEVFCCHENEKEIYGDIKDRVLLLHQKCPDLHGIFDPANYIQCGQVPKEIFAQLQQYIDYLHIKDALLVDGSVVPAGKGDGEIGYILEQFRVKGETKLLTIEPHLSIFDSFSSLQHEEIKHRYAYNSQGEAFDAAVNALKKILDERGFTYE